MKTQKKKKKSHRLKAEDIYTFLLRVLMVSRVTVFPQPANIRTEQDYSKTTGRWTSGKMKLYVYDY